MTDASPAPRWPGSVALVLASSTGGVGQHVRSITRGLTEAGASVLVCGPAATEEQFDFTAAGARFTPVEIPASPTPGDARAVTALRRALTDTPVDVVHAHGLRAGLVAALARPAAPLVVTWHNAVLAGGLRGAVSRLVERVVARSVRVALGASADLVDRAAALGAADARLAPVAAPALPAPRRRRTAVRAEFAAADQQLILSVGRLHPQKRYDVLIDAAARWRNRTPAPLVVIAGSGPAYLPLAARISAARAPVTLVGHRTDVADLLGAADLAVVTSDWEARQLFAQEALRAGVPLVATDVGGLPDLVGDAAVLVPPGDVDAVDAAVRDLLDDPVRRADLGRRGLARAATWPTEADTVAALAGLYAELTPQLSTGNR
ncbi:glycosyltransferase family 4 protein [Micromonospora marina]|uniref:Glycosyltransferase involved in cell wall bisynthesis n=1 Tax=Micromonospora marina TaxID=307120 RepID=A0A1C5AJ53_9ACTN|nr:glycosyltransferase family 4 protein [Micromonospora marina]SCF45189.1 Glycosyltransferase involved in cell wall bisynthesis [Micromonospora marina]